MVELTLGVLSDIRGEHNKVSSICNQLKNSSIDAIIVAGDVCSRNRRDNESILRSLLPISKLDKDIYVIPGSHETKTEYCGTLDALTEQYANVHDMSKSSRKSKIKGFDFVFFPGSDWIISDIAKGKDNYRLTEQDYAQLKQDLESSTDATLVSHIPPKGIGDVADFGEVTKPFSLQGHNFEKESRVPGEVARMLLRQNFPIALKSESVGCPELAKIIKDLEVKRSLFGHIHESGGWGYVQSGNVVSPRNWAEELFCNVSGVCDRKYGLFGLKTENKTTWTKYEPRRVA